MTVAFIRIKPDSMSNTDLTLISKLCKTLSYSIDCSSSLHRHLPRVLSSRNILARLVIRGAVPTFLAMYQFIEDVPQAHRGDD